MIKNLIFDFDGVLADTFPFAVRAAMEINEELNLLNAEKVKPEDFRASDLEEFITKFKIPKLKLLLFIFKYRKRLRKEILSTPTFNDLPQTLLELKTRGIKLGIVTSNQKKIVEEFLNHNNLQVFDFVSSTINVFHKENSLRKALNKFHLKKEETIYIGDETRDIKASRATGLKVASVTWGWNLESKLLEYSPDFIINRPQELLTLIQ